ncbi:hypothetical protein Tco_0749823 [Tanacetum coccineum]|uniref:Uncharacterized protein n=1 Tax=Tanacetum coccineum TaxID=301880 RepID=A0ABQ4Z0C8_9ASTR
MVAEQNQRTLVGAVTTKRTFVVLIEDGGEVVVRVAVVVMRGSGVVEMATMVVRVVVEMVVSAGGLAEDTP